LWVLILEAAGYDPLRAQEIVEGVNQVWWERWMVDRRHRLEAEKKARNGGKSKGGFAYW
jgi:hypothetical protein